MLSPSGQERLKSLADVKIICLDCFTEHPPEDANYQHSAGSAENASRELSTAVPNSWKSRN
jgi:hypothetical protein